MPSNFPRYPGPDEPDEKDESTNSPTPVKPRRGWNRRINPLVAVVCIVTASVVLRSIMLPNPPAPAPEAWTEPQLQTQFVGKPMTAIIGQFGMPKIPVWGEKDQAWINLTFDRLPMNFGGAKVQYRKVQFEGKRGICTSVLIFLE